MYFFLFFLITQVPNVFVRLIFGAEGKPIISHYNFYQIESLRVLESRETSKRSILHLH